MTTPGHNSISAERLTQFVQRVERLTEEKAALGVDIREVYNEAKSAGFDPKIMREVVKLRAMDPSDMEERKSLVELYLSVLAPVV